jgi:hypothetical protein
MIITITPDKEKAKSISNIASMGLEFLRTIDKDKFPIIALETYYEIIKEQCSSILLIERYKTIGEYAHKELLQKIRELKIISEQEFRIVDDLRIRRNTSSYDGVETDTSFLNNKTKIEKIIEKLREEIKVELRNNI